jgi:hypothetical protein
MAGTDCDFGGRCHPQIAWPKLQALTEGAELAVKNEDVTPGDCKPEWPFTGGFSCGRNDTGASPEDVRYGSMLLPRDETRRGRPKVL